MDFKNLLKATNKPALYEPGNATMWTDDYISKQLLKVHLNPEIDAAARKPGSIAKTVEFILGCCDRPKMDILDLGSGPGLYAEELAFHGHQITGVDYSENSISYARKQALEKNLNIQYLCQNYLELDFQGRFDLIMLIYADFGVLIPDERTRLLENVWRALKPGGIFIFDVINDRNKDKKFSEIQTWNVENSGFWRKGPYLELIKGVHYMKDMVYLKQHTIVDEFSKIKTYRFWTHYYDVRKLTSLLLDKQFEHIQSFNNILPAGDIWNGENITFYSMNKPNQVS